MRIGDIIAFRKDLYFEGAVQADWFYVPEKSAKVAENFVFHGKDYYGGENAGKGKTIDTVSLTRTLVQKLVDESANPLSLAIADYGTGKSHLAVTLAQLFSGASYLPDTFKSIIQNIKTIDEESANIIQSACSDRNFVLVINGMRDFNLHYEILRAAQKSLCLYGLSDEKLKNLNRAVETASLFFERNVESQLPLFESSASEFGWTETGEKLVARIKDSLLTDDNAFSIVNGVYKQVTGKEISWDEGISARSVLEMLLAEYCGLNGQFDHVIILFDEFGRYLEYASGSDAGKSGDSALQQIFEVSQDADGALQVINFIQSDIKSYLVRVDQTRNISRYIGRYDQSDKYHISSNLETVFANLIYRNDKNAFTSTIVKWQTEHETQWKTIYQHMCNWLPLSGVWSNYNLFRKIIVEGIYPMHPLSTFMLTQLSDYLQNRSSLTLTSQYISEISDRTIEDEIPLITPDKLMSGDLYQEMLSSEISGKQLSQHCIRFDNILRKVGDKLSDNSLAVLRANLIARILRFKTHDYEDAKAALLLCSGLDVIELDDALNLLENEYAVLGFDEHAGCFDFMEESRGAHEYKIQKKRLAANWKTDFRAMFKTAKILEIGEISEPQETSFGTNRKILTNEWKFAQEILLAEDLTEKIATEYLHEWRETRSAALPKGRLIWVYVNKDTEYQYVERLHKIASILQGSPIVLMLLNDSEERFSRALSNYDLLDKMDDTIRQTYARAYSDDFNQAEEILRNEFDTLKKQRLYVGPEEVQPLKKRLQIALTDVFESLYPQATSFNFDGLLTSSNNFTGKGSTYFCQIVKMLLSNNINYDTIHDFTSDVRSKINAVLMETSATSWKCISSGCVIIPPAEEYARAIYDDVVKQLNAAKEYHCSDFFDKYCYPPYGLSEEAAVMMLGVILANFSYCIRIQYNSSQNSIIRWKDEVIIKDKKINMELIKSSVLILIDTDAVEARFQQLFHQLEATKDIDMILRLQNVMQKYADDNGVPEKLEVNYKLANARFESARKAQHEWNDGKYKVQDELDNAEEKHNVYSALTALEQIDAIPVYSIFNENGFEMSNLYRSDLSELDDRARELVQLYFDEWVEGTIHCKSVEAMTQFEKHVKRCNEKLLKFGFKQYATVLAEKGELELAKKDEIRSRQELLADGQKYLTAFKTISLTNFTDVSDMLSKANLLIDRLVKFESSLGNDAVYLHRQLDERICKLESAKAKMKQDMENIWENLANAQSEDDLYNIQSCISQVMNYRLSVRDLQDFEDLKTALEQFLSDLKTLHESIDDRSALELAVQRLREKYVNSEFDFDVQTVLEHTIDDVRSEQDSKEQNWKENHLNLGDRSRETIHRWKESVRIIPHYVSAETIEMVDDLQLEAEDIISQAMIDDVVFYFQKLDKSEKTACIDRLLKIYNQINDEDSRNEETELEFSRNQSWDLEEWIVMVQFYFLYHDKKRSELLEEYSKLSQLLNRRAEKLGITKNEKYRNVNGLAMQCDRIRYIVTHGEHGLSAYSELAEEALKMYQNQREEFDFLAQRCWERY